MQIALYFNVTLHHGYREEQMEEEKESVLIYKGAKFVKMLRRLGSNKSSGMIFMGRIKQGVNIEIKAACG